MNCRDFLNEFEERNALSKAATLHLKDCAACRKINSVQTRVWRTIDGFAPVDAPNGFNFRVKARIASTKSEDFQPRFLPVLRYVLPLGLVILISATIIFNSLYFNDSQNVPQVAQVEPQKSVQKSAVLPESSPSEQIAGSNIPQKSDNEKLPATVSNPKTEQAQSRKMPKNIQDQAQFISVKSVRKTQGKTDKDTDKNSGGSQVLAVSPPRIILPKGIPSQTVRDLPSAENVNLTTVEEILSLLGIEITTENGKREVKKIKQNSVAEHSGVKVGDLVEAIDGEKLTGEPIRSKTVEGTKMTVVRGAERMEIILHN